jgi:hypothetical protein
LSFKLDASNGKACNSCNGKAWRAMYVRVICVMVWFVRVIHVMEMNIREIHMHAMRARARHVREYR